MSNAGDVLLMEDDEDIRATLRFLLEDARFAVREAPDGHVGLALLRASRQRLVVLVDYRMPRLDGIGVLRAVAADDHLARQHVYLLVTANYDQLPPEAEDVLDALAVRTLRKPFDIDTMLAAVQSAHSRLLSPAGGPTSAPPDARSLRPYDQPTHEEAP